MENPIYNELKNKIMTLQEYYAKHNEDHRLTTRHGFVEYTVSMKYIHEILNGDKSKKILDLGAGTGRYSVALANEGYDVTAVELCEANLKVLESKHAKVKIWPGNAKDIHFLEDNTFDVTIFFGPLYHLHGDDEKLIAFREAMRVTKKGGVILAAYVMNDYSILTYCFDMDRISTLMSENRVDSNFKIHSPDDELYDYVGLDDINRLNEKTGLKRIKIFSPDGPADYMRRQLNAMSEESFQKFIEFQLCNAERPDLLGAGSHLVDVLQN